MLAATTLVLTTGISAGCARQESGAITGPYASLLASSSDLGPSHSDDAQLTVTLTDPKQAQELIRWASDRGLSVRGQPDDAWG